MIGEKRSSLEILQEVMRLAQAGNKKTRIMYGANLSFEMLNKYLDFLLVKRFLDQDKASGKFLVSKEGVEFMRDLERVLRHVREPATPTPAMAF